MKEHGLIFTSDSVRAILDGRKTQTRRVISRANSRPPRIMPGDTIWVRETYTWTHSGGVIYREDWERHKNEEWYVDFGGLWKSPIFMPRECARIVLRVTAVRAQRLQDISEADAIAEGVIIDDIGISAADCFSGHWGVVNGKRNPWESNPPVWVYEFAMDSLE